MVVKTFFCLLGILVIHGIPNTHSNVLFIDAPTASAIGSCLRNLGIQAYLKVLLVEFIFNTCIRCFLGSSNQRRFHLIISIPSSIASHYLVIKSSNLSRLFALCELNKYCYQVRYNYLIVLKVLASLESFIKISRYVHKLFYRRLMAQ